MTISFSAKDLPLPSVPNSASTNLCEVVAPILRSSEWSRSNTLWPEEEVDDVRCG